MPTTPLLLLAAALFLRSSKPLYDWLMNHPKLGPYIKNFMVHKSIPLKVKIISVSRNYSSYPVIQYSLKTLQFLSVTEF